jgi:hypothetical protein
MNGSTGKIIIPPLVSATVAKERSCTHGDVQVVGLVIVIGLIGLMGLIGPISHLRLMGIPLQTADRSPKGSVVPLNLPGCTEGIEPLAVDGTEGLAFLLRGSG